MSDEFRKSSETDKIRLALSQRLAHYWTQLELRGEAPAEVFKHRYEHHYQQILGVLTAVLSGGIVLSLEKLLSGLSETNQAGMEAELFFRCGLGYL